MNRFPENLARLRRQAGYTQETLAEAMGVSRQAVGKWESGQAMPEAATLVDLADLLGCSLDQLMRQELPELPEGEAAAEPEEPDAEQVGLFRAYAAHMDRFALTIASGVALILLGVAAITLLESTRLGDSDLGGAVFLLSVAAAVFLFVWGGIAHGNFKKDHPDVPLLWTDEERGAFRHKFQLGIALAVAGVLTDVALLTLLQCVTGRGETADNLSVSLFMAILAGCVWVFVYLGIQKEKMDGPSEPPRPDSPWSGVIMMCATAIYLVLGFVWNLWHPGWVIFPVGGILCGIIETLRRAK